VHRHPLAKRRDALRKPAARLRADAVDPVQQGRARGVEEPRGLRLGELARLLHGRELRAVQDLVRIRVADAAQDPRVCHRALERVVLTGQRRAERGEVRVEHLEAARIVLLQAGFAARQIERGPALGAGLGQDQGPRREIERGQTDLGGRLGAGGLPVKAPGDHEVQDQEHVALEPDHDALAEPPKAGHAAIGRFGERRIDRAEQERARETHALERFAEDARLERLDVDRDVGKLGHRVKR
jgi:hypothetical protein